MTETDHRHHDFRGDLRTRHACPECPIPGSVPDGITRVANERCPYCQGTGLVDGDQLVRWQHDADRALYAGS